MAQSATLSGGSRSRSALTRAAVVTVEIALIAAIAFALARLIWLVAFGASAGNFEAASANSRNSNEAGSGYIADLNALANAQLFADRRSEPEVVAVAQQAPETQLNLVLRGIRGGADPQSGAAIIQTPDNRQQFFSVGATVMDGVTLEEVHVDHVIISRRGIAESLYLRERDERQTGTAPTAAPSPAARSAVNATGADRLPGFELAEIFQVRPAVQNGRMIGYRLTGDNAVILEAVGLRPGDIVTAVNGRSLADVSDLNGLFEQIEEEENAVSLSVQRNGLSLNIQVELP